MHGAEIIKAGETHMHQPTIVRDFTRTLGPQHTRRSERAAEPERHHKIEYRQQLAHGADGTRSRIDKREDKFMGRDE